MGDAFIRNYIEDLLQTIRTQVLLKVIKPYTRIRIGFIATELNIPASEVPPPAAAATHTMGPATPLPSLHPRVPSLHPHVPSLQPHGISRSSRC